MSIASYLNQDQMAAMVEGIHAAIRGHTPVSEHTYQDIRIDGINKALPTTLGIVFKASAITVSVLDTIESAIVHGAQKDLGIRLRTSIVGVNAYTNRKVKVVLSFSMSWYVRFIEPPI